MLKQASPAGNRSNLLPFLPALTTTATSLLPTQVDEPAGNPVRRPWLLTPGLGPDAAQGRTPSGAGPAFLAHDARNALASITLLAGLLGEPEVLRAGDVHLAEDLAKAARVLGGIVEQWAALGASSDPSKAGVISKCASEPKWQQTRRLARPLQRDARARPAVGAGVAIESCAGLLRVAAGPGTAVFVSCESGLPPLAIGEDALLRVLTNLVKNAGEAMPQGGTVRVTARRALSRTAPAVLVHVADDGPGIPPLLLERIFEPGVSAKSGAGRGLGLAIVRQLVEAAGGKITVASTLRRGTTFELRLPCA